MPEKDRIEYGYRKLRAFRPGDIITIHDEAAKIGETWSFGVRDLGSIHYLANRIIALGEARRSPSVIAAVTLHFVVREHPFWDANHRSGFELAQLILRAFGLRIEAPREEVERFVRSIDTNQLPLEDVEHWVKKWARRLR